MSLLKQIEKKIFLSEEQLKWQKRMVQLMLKSP